MLRWHIEAKELHLRYTWKISRNSSDSKTNLFIRVADQHYVGIGEAAPNIRYNETADALTNQFTNLIDNGLELVRSLEDLQILLSIQVPANALRFAIESAYIHYHCQRLNISVGEFLGVALPLAVPTAFTLPIMDPGLIKSFILENNLTRFQPLKIKVNGENALDLIREVNKSSNCPLIIDGNEAWDDPDIILKVMEQLHAYPIVMLEQPMPAAQVEEYIYLKQHTKYDLFADESVTNHADFNLIAKQFHGVNMKLMKAGGYLNGKFILEQARRQGLKTMIGCMVETSLGIWSALQLCQGIGIADLDGFLILKEEPFGIVQEREGKLFIN